MLKKSLSEYGMAIVLLLICAYYSWATLGWQTVEGAAPGDATAAEVLARSPKPQHVAIVARPGGEDDNFAVAAEARLKAGGVAMVTRIDGSDPATARGALVQIAKATPLPEVFIATAQAGAWLPNVIERVPAFSGASISSPKAVYWPTFLMKGNLFNIASAIAVIAVISLGMTMVIITGGIDLSVGSLVALSAVVAAGLIRDHAGGERAGAGAMVLCCLAAIGVSGLVGAFSGVMIATCRVPPFIATLAMMRVTSGIAYELADGHSIYGVPASFTWLGRGNGLLGVPNAVWLMVAIFFLAHVLMSKTRTGRYIYAVGGNAEAARLSGVRVKSILIYVYIISGLAAGLGGVILASTLRGGAPTYGTGYELSVITAVVVGGTSLAGGEGRVFGTLIGAFIIAVIQNGMNLTNVSSYRQMIVLGLLILAAVLIDQLKRQSWKLPNFLKPAPATPTGAAPLTLAPAVAEREAERAAEPVQPGR